VFGDRKALRQSRSTHYAVAVLVTVFALLCRYLMTPEWGVSLPFITLYPAIAFSAWFGGFGPGVLSTCLGSLTVAYFWPAHFGGTSTAGDVLALALFAAVGIFVSGLTRALQDARTRAERTAEALGRAREEAERANRAKDEFLAVVAHELKQPLSAMVPAVALMRHRLSPESLAASDRTLDVLQRQIVHLQRVVNDLLDASRVVRGQVTLQPVVVNAMQIMRDAIDVVRPRAEQRQQRILVDLPESDVMLNADPVRLQQVLLNVLSNATAYTPPHGEIRVRADVNAAQVVFRIRDTGEGIAPDDLPRIFGLFTRAEGRREGGFGIGLAVARGLVELHGGTIEAASDGPGRGSEFRITLPSHRATDMAARPMT
jgi:signal transduction histidine kinase